MITDSTVLVYTRIATTNSRGQTTNAYTYAKSIAANLQPIALNPTTMAAWGNLNLSADDRIMFFYPDDGINKLDRIQDAWGDMYEVRNVNKWGAPPFGHFEALLVPVQGE